MITNFILLQFIIKIREEKTNQFDIKIMILCLISLEMSIVLNSIYLNDLENMSLILISYCITTLY